jgi:hypothetical protein
VRSETSPELSALSEEATETPPLFVVAEAPLRTDAARPLSAMPSLESTAASP